MKLKKGNKGKKKAKAKDDCIHLACKNGNVEEVERILEEEPHLISAKGSREFTPLMKAIWHKQIEVVELLLNKSDAKNGQDDGILFGLAAERGSTEIIGLLLQRELNVNSQTSDGTCPIHKAVKAGDNLLTEFLLQNGANIESKTDSGHTPLHLAVAAGSSTIVRSLLENGANLDAETEDGNHETPFDIALKFSCKKNYDSSILETLHSARCEQEDSTLQQNSALPEEFHDAESSLGDTDSDGDSVNENLSDAGSEESLITSPKTSHAAKTNVKHLMQRIRQLETHIFESTKRSNQKISQMKAKIHEFKTFKRNEADLQSKIREMEHNLYEFNKRRDDTENTLRDQLQQRGYDLVRMRQLLERKECEMTVMFSRLEREQMEVSLLQAKLASLEATFSEGAIVKTVLPALEGEIKKYDIETLNVLEERLKACLEETQKVKMAIKPDTCCAICLVRKKSVLLLPCKHLCLCDHCSKIQEVHSNQCPICRQFIMNSISGVFC